MIKQVKDSIEDIRLTQTRHYPELALTIQQTPFISTRVRIEAALWDVECTGYNIESNEQILGFILIKRFSEDKVFLWNMIIDVNYQKQGIGKISLQKLFDQLKLEGIRKITTTCLARNRVALDFYMKSGFTQFETIVKDDTEEINLMMHLDDYTNRVAV